MVAKYCIECLSGIYYLQNIKQVGGIWINGNQSYQERGKILGNGYLIQYWAGYLPLWCVV